MKPAAHLTASAAVCWLGIASLVAQTIGAKEPQAVPFYPDKMNLLCWIDEAGQTHPITTRDA